MPDGVSLVDVESGKTLGPFLEESLPLKERGENLQSRRKGKIKV